MEFFRNDFTEPIRADCGHSISSAGFGYVDRESSPPLTYCEDCGLEPMLAQEEECSEALE